ncbi:MAG: hypothetical protein SH857_15590 [Chitinophagales bacterium]|nr:hypothetical protein [Chitinophagales bacterium]
MRWLFHFECLRPIISYLSFTMIFAFRFIPYSAIALYPFILIKRNELRNNASLIHHEKIHHRQQLELWILPFYLLYVLHYFFNLLKYHNHYKAYRAIIFEREAYAMDNDFEYLKKRKPFAFLKFN